MDKPKEYETKEYSDDEILELLSDCILIQPEYYKQLPDGAQIRYIRRDDPAAPLPRGKRFRAGGFIGNQGISKDSNKPFMFIKVSNDPKDKRGHKVEYDQIEELYKRYHYESRIELNMIRVSLHKLRTENIELKERIIRLEKQTGISSISPRQKK